VRLNEYGIWKSGSTPSRTNQSFYGGDIPWVKSGEVKQGRIKETSETITEIALKKCSLHRNPIGSVLIAMYGANIGEVGVLEIEAATNQAVCACKTYSPISNEFLYYLLLSLKSNFISQGAGAAQPNISREKIINTVVPLPPLSEQKRIVKKIEDLFDLSDLLERNIDESSKKQTQILNSFLANI
jgi:type I restriction enzyme S subunit